MTKSDLVEALHEKLGGGVTKKGSSDIVNLVFELIKETLASGESLKISGFGNFVIREKSERIGRNPQTNQAMVIAGRRVVSFKPSQILKNSLNQ